MIKKKPKTLSVGDRPEIRIVQVTFTHTHKLLVLNTAKAYFLVTLIVQCVLEGGLLIFATEEPRLTELHLSIACPNTEGRRDLRITYHL